MTVVKENAKNIYRVTEKGKKEVKANYVEGIWESDEHMFRHVAWIKDMTAQLTQTYIRMTQSAPKEKVDNARFEMEQLLLNMKEEPGK